MASQQEIIPESQAHITIEDRIKYLQKTDLFKSFSKKELKNFAEKISEVKLAAGEILFTEDDVGTELFILIQGTMTVFKGNRIITTIKPIDYVGEMGIIEAKPRSATVSADEPCLLLMISQEMFQGYFSGQPNSLVAMMKNLSQRIRRDTESIADEYERINILIHDMKNTLVTFLFLEILEKNMTEPENAKYIKHMRESRENLSAMMEDALSNAKRLRRPLSAEQYASLHDLVNDMAESEFAISPDLTDKQLKISVIQTMPDCTYRCLDIRRILSNLVLNAAQASKKGDTIEIELDRQDDYAVLRVKDSGEGIPKKIKMKIFTPHFTTKSEGNGLGLASCKQLIENKYGGILSFESQQGVGTTFTCMLPLSKSTPSS